MCIRDRCDDREEWEKAAERRRWEAEEREAEVLAGAEDSPLDVRLTSSGTSLVGIGHLVIRMPSFKLKINPGGCLTPRAGERRVTTRAANASRGRRCFEAARAGPARRARAGVGERPSPRRTTRETRARRAKRTSVEAY